MASMEMISLPVSFSELIETRDDKKLLRFQKQIASYELLIVDELGFVPLSKTGVPGDRSSSLGWKTGVPGDRSSSLGWKTGA